MKNEETLEVLEKRIRCSKKTLDECVMDCNLCEVYTEVDTVIAAMEVAVGVMRGVVGEEKNEPLHGHIVWKERSTGGYKYVDDKCPICGSTVTVEVSHPMEHDKVPYCSECGKRIDDRFMRFCPACGVPLDDDHHTPKKA